MIRVTQSSRGHTARRRLPAGMLELKQRWELRFLRKIPFGHWVRHCGASLFGNVASTPKAYFRACTVSSVDSFTLVAALFSRVIRSQTIRCDVPGQQDPPVPPHPRWRPSVRYSSTTPVLFRRDGEGQRPVAHSVERTHKPRRLIAQGDRIRPRARSRAPPSFRSRT